MIETRNSFHKSSKLSLVTLKKIFMKLPRTFDQNVADKLSMPVTAPNMVASMFYGISLAITTWAGIAYKTTTSDIVSSVVKHKYTKIFLGLITPPVKRAVNIFPITFTEPDMHRRVLNSHFLQHMK